MNLSRKHPTQWRSIVFCLLLAAVSGFAQNVSFSKLPANLQLYPRNAQNNADVVITGTVSTLGYERMSVWVYRNTTPYQYQYTKLNYQNNSAGFSLNTTIKAELAQYHFRVYACKAGDSTLVLARDNIVAGDVYLINGQSNASASADSYTYRNEYCRSFGIYTNNNNYDAYNPADTLWTYSGKGQALVGVWGIELQRYIVEKFQIPVCIINGASGGSSIEYNIIRNASNPTDLNTTYGRLLYRVQKAGVQQHIKAIFWRQGENECGGNALGYPANFNTLYNFWKQDYPSAQKIYVFQVNILSFPLETAGKYVRDFQRRTKGLYPNVETIATVGTKFYDGVHYQLDGYKQTGVEIFRLVARDFYGSNDIQHINSPNIKRAYFSNATKTKITLEFDMPMVYPADSTLFKNGHPYLRRLRDFFYLNGQAGLVESGEAVSNTIVLSLKTASNATQISYLPAYFSDNYSDFLDVPQLTNPRGMRALVFYDFPLGTHQDDPNAKEEIEIATPPGTPIWVTVPPAEGSSQPTPNKADLSLLMDVTNLTPQVGEEIKVSILVKNAGPNKASNVRLNCLLPENFLLTAVEDMSQTANILATSNIDIESGTYMMWSFKAKAQLAGKQTLRAEITQSSLPDPNSTPNNGFNNNEDDTKTLVLDVRPSTQTIAPMCQSKCVPFWVSIKRAKE